LPENAGRIHQAAVERGMVTSQPADLKQSQGPSGFIDLAGTMLVVDYGRIYQDGAPIGFLFEDGFLKDTSGPLGVSDKLRPIEDIPDCVFRGIDAQGINLVLPGTRRGPNGILHYNGVRYDIVHGRIAGLNHIYCGEFDDDGVVSVRDPAGEDGFRPLSESSQLGTVFEGHRSNGERWRHEHVRPLFRKDRTYTINEIIRYFQGFDNLTTAQKKYVIDTMALWSSCGILQLVRKSEGDASLGNVRHGAAGVTGVRTGNVTLDREEFEREIELYGKFGALAVVSKGIKDLTEVRLNLVVAHEFGHQLEFVLTQAAQEKITEIFEHRKRSCDKLHPLPSSYNGYSELLSPHQVMERHFLSGYGRTSMHEFWAECVAAFSVKESREKLKELEPGIYKLLEDIILSPTTILRRTLHDTILELQASLRLGREFNNDILSR